ncbi:hypothetical protein HMPREF1076_03362 [Parabacteroides goldsteinii CL02T12C30]|uniref:Uncharacterized protein n=1 Tax=Parabacteroides goldsteinii CL02T12C30 TaxID=999418 RepID=K5YF70_9BACT|nr:hypothetical protein HMPREF1076_03362 [Parabacteroides goldsteinii CL02T12C30]
MKKTLFLLALACSLPTAGHSQGFMKKLKQKVENAVGISESTDIAEDQTQADDNHDGNSDGNKPIQRPTPSDKLQKLRTATATWDEAVTPSKASSIEALLKELPPLPSVDEMANPNAAARETYYRKIVAVTTRVRELDKQYTCSNEEMIAFRENMYASTAKKLGITEAELRALENDMTSEAEKERITQKIVSNTIGDMSSLEAMAVDIEKREAAAGGELSDQDRLAILAEHGNAMEDLGALMEKSSSLSSIQSGSGDAELDQRLAELMQKQMEGPPNPLINYNKILGKNAAVLKNLYARLCNTDDPAEIEQIYTEADELAKRARREAAVTWRKYLAQIPGRADRTEQGALPAEYVPAGRHGESRNDPRLCRETRQPQYRDHLRQFPRPGLQRISRTGIHSRLQGEHHEIPEKRTDDACRERLCHLRRRLLERQCHLDNRRRERRRIHLRERQETRNGRQRSAGHQTTAAKTRRLRAALRHLDFAKRQMDRHLLARRCPDPARRLHLLSLGIEEGRQSADMGRGIR